MKRLAPPSGSQAPAAATLRPGERIELVQLAEELSSRYFAEFPDDLDSYGDAAREWCVHDNRYILAWAIGDLAGHRMLADQVEWLAGLLAARDYPLERLARNLELAGDVLAERVPERRDEAVGLLAGAAAAVRANV